MTKCFKISLFFLLLLFGVSLGVSKGQAVEMTMDNVSGSDMWEGGYFNDGMKQNFNTGTSTNLSRLMLWNTKTGQGSPNYNVKAYIYDNNNELVASSSNSMTCTSSYENHEFTFDNLELATGTDFWVQVSPNCGYGYAGSGAGNRGLWWSDLSSARWGENVNTNITFYTEYNPAYCGDTICNNNETVETCQEDCQVCGDNVCNGDETPLSCVIDCPIISRYNNIIKLNTDVVDMPLVPDTVSVFYYTYNTTYITQDGWGDIAYIHIARCLDVGCSTTEPWYFTNADGSATSSESFILGKGIDFASTTDTFGSSIFLLKNRADELGIATTTRETYKITPTYITPGSFPPEVIEANAVAQVINWQSFNDVVPCQQFSFDCSSDTLCAGMNLEKLMNQMWCAVKGATCDTGQFFFVPDCQTLRTLNNSYLVFKSAFPFNLYFDLADSIDTAIDNTATSSTSTIGIPFIDRNSTSSDKFIILPVVSSSSMSNAIGSENVSVFRLTVGFLIWLVCAFIVYLIILKI
jgi:hypothetical protein